MARRDDAVTRLRQGRSPSLIAREMGVTVSTVVQYLYHGIGHGTIRRSDVVFSISRDLRQFIERAITERNSTDIREVYQALRKADCLVDSDELEMYLELRDARNALGDMYEHLRATEVLLHAVIKNVLVLTYGQEGWWRDGIPENIRAECAAAQEKDPEAAAEKYCYTTFIHLKEILDRRWDVFQKVLKMDKKKLLSALGKLNHIRNSVMHPVKGKEVSEEDFGLLLDFQRELTSNLERWFQEIRSPANT